MTQLNAVSAATTPQRPTVAVVGPGAIGTTVAAALHEAGHTPVLCGRSPRAQLELQHADDSIIVPGPVRVDPAELDGTVDLVFLAVKATQLDAAAHWLAGLCHPGTVVCVLQNGIEQVSSVAPHAPEAHVLPAVVWFPAEALSGGAVRLRGEPRLTVPDDAAGGLVREALADTRCSVELAADFTSVAWRKLLQNAVAGLMVLSGRRAGMFRRHDVARLAHDYLLECLAVAQAEGAALGDEVTGDIVAAFQAYPADMGTSILADREAGRPLEWDVRNGVIVRRARAHGIPTPIGDVVVPLLAAASDTIA